MGDLVGGAVLGTTVSQLTEALSKEISKFVDFKKHFKGLEELVNKVEPTLEKFQNSQLQGVPLIASWLKELAKCLTDAQEVVKKYGKPTVWKRRSAGKLVKKAEKSLQDLLDDTRIDKLLMFQFGDDLCTMMAKVSLTVDSLSRIIYNEEHQEQHLKELAGQLEGIKAHVKGQSSQHVEQQGPSKKRKKQVEVQPLSDECILGRKKVTEDVKKMIIDSNIKKIAIHGMGGVGKTTVVQMINNDPEVQAHFNEQIYWIMVSREPHIQYLQDKLYERIAKEKTKFGTIEEGKTELFNLLQEKDCLLILDDVWEKVVLECMDVVSSNGSKLVVTTRKSDILTDHDIYTIPMHGLSYNDSWDLFCHHAFRSQPFATAIEGYVKIAVEECKGLPLALKVVGAAMVAKKEVWEWEHACRCLQQADIIDRNQDDALYDRLKISYDELGDLQKRIGRGIKLQECFLYFAAFPEDFNLSIPHLRERWAVQQFVTAETDVQFVLGILVASSLVETSYEGFLMVTFKMHDVLRDLAIRISRDKRSGQDLFLAGSSTFPENVIWNKLQRISLTQTKIRFLPPPAIFGPNLILLDASFSRIQKFPMVPRGRFPSLKFLSLSHSSLEEFENVKDHGLDQLEILDLSSCAYLKKLPPSFGKPLRLSCLKTLDLKFCEWLIDFPKVEKNGLNQLQELNLSCSGLTRLPSSFGKPLRLSCLRKLDMQQCQNLEEFPEVEENGLNQLQELNLSLCCSLRRLPSSFGKSQRLLCLETLDLKQSGIEEVPEVEENGLDKLQKLNLAWCSGPQRLPSSFGEPRRLSCLKELLLCGTFMDCQPNVEFKNLKSRLEYRGVYVGTQ